jgi:hypothetical protein
LIPSLSRRGATTAARSLCEIATAATGFAAHVVAMTCRNQRRSWKSQTLNPMTQQTDLIPEDIYRIGKFLRVVTSTEMPDQRCVVDNKKKIIGLLWIYKPWKQWVLLPQPNTMWSIDCLADIETELKRLNQAEKPT